MCSEQNNEVEDMGDRINDAEWPWMKSGNGIKNGYR